MSRRLAALIISLLCLACLASTTACAAESKEAGTGVYIFQQGNTREVMILYSDGSLGYYTMRSNGQRFEKTMGCEGSCGRTWKRTGNTITTGDAQGMDAEYYVDAGDLIEVKVVAPLEAKDFAARGPDRRFSRVAKFKEALF